MEFYGLNSKSGSIKLLFITIFLSFLNDFE